jgi:hypothetical protein
MKEGLFWLWLDVELWTLVPNTEELELLPIGEMLMLFTLPCTETLILGAAFVPWGKLLR